MYARSSKRRENNGRNHKKILCLLAEQRRKTTDRYICRRYHLQRVLRPEYHGIRQIQQWFHDWNQKGTVQKWDVKQIYISRNTAIIEWYFQCNYCNTPGAFDGVTIAQFDGNNKIYNLKEFQSKCDHEYPYEPV